MAISDAPPTVHLMDLSLWGSLVVVMLVGVSHQGQRETIVLLGTFHGGVEDGGEMRGELLEDAYAAQLVGVCNANVIEDPQWQQAVDAVELLRVVLAAVVGHCKPSGGDNRR
ncbi:hypothetical protein SEVIR_9G406101v4 [Setaria viridis]